MGVFVKAGACTLGDATEVKIFDVLECMMRISHGWSGGNRRKLLGVVKVVGLKMRMRMSRAFVVIVELLSDFFRHYQLKRWGCRRKISRGIWAILVCP